MKSTLETLFEFSDILHNEEELIKILKQHDSRCAYIERLEKEINTLRAVNNDQSERINELYTGVLQWKKKYDTASKLNSELNKKISQLSTTTNQQTLEELEANHKTLQGLYKNAIEKLNRINALQQDLVKAKTSCEMLQYQLQEKDIDIDGLTEELENAISEKNFFALKYDELVEELKKKNDGK